MQPVSSTVPLNLRDSPKRKIRQVTFEKARAANKRVSPLLHSVVLKAEG